MAQVRIFVSHSSHDNAWSRPFADALKAVGYDVWYDETGLQGGAAWVASIQHEVETRDVFLLVLTPEAWESKWVQDELQLAIATRRRILPVLLRNTQVSGFLLTTQWITVVGEEPQAVARVAIMAIEAPPASGQNAMPQAATETLDDLRLLCRSLAAGGRYTESLSACERALALDKNNIEVLRIKAWVFDKIGEHRLEGQTLFQILVLDPDDESLWSVPKISTPFGEFRDYGGYDYNYIRIFRALTDEQELLQAYSLLRSSRHWSEPPVGDVRILLPIALIEGLKRIDRLDAVVAKWYGDLPHLNTLSDIRTLYMYAEIFMKIGRPDDARKAYDLIVHIFENRYGSALKWRFVKRLRDGAFIAPWDDPEAFQLYLASLDARGRSNYASQLRGDYSN